MRALETLVGPELSGRRLRAMLLLLGVVVLSSTAIVAGLSTQQQAGSRWDQAFTEAHGAHVTISSNDPASLERVAGDPRVEARSAPYRVASDVDVTRGTDLRSETLVVGMDAADRPTIAVPLLREGRWATGRDEAVVDRAFALDEGVALGDRVQLSLGERTISVRVVGQALNLRDTFYPDGDATVWLPRSGFSALVPADQGGLAVFLRLRAPEEAESFVADVSGQVGTMDWLDTRTDVLRGNAVFGTFLRVLGAFLMVAAAIVVAGAVATRVLSRRRDIGLLKAIGVTPGQVTGAVVLAHVLVAANGVLVGWVAGGLLTAKLQLQVAEVLGSAGPAFEASALLVAMAVVQVLVVLSTALPAWRAGRMPTTEALAPFATGRAHRSRLAAAGERLGLGPVAVTGLRDAFARPARGAMTALALAVAVVAVVVTAGFDRTIDGVFDDTAVAGEPQELEVVAAGGTTSVARALDSTPGITSWWTETDSNAVLDDEQLLAVALGGEVARAGFVVREGRMLRGAGEAVTGYGFLRRFGAEIGDTVEIELRGAPVTLRLVGWYSEAEDAGEMMMLSLADLESVEPGVRPDLYAANVARDADPAAVATALGGTLGTRARVDVVGPTDADRAALDPFRFSVWLISALVVLVALANLAATLALGVRERAHDLAVLRAVGFAPAQAMAVVATGGLVLALVATSVGLPLGWFLSAAANDGVGAEIGMGPGIARDPSWALLALLVPLVLALSAGLAVLASRRAATAEVAQLVRYE